MTCGDIGFNGGMISINTQLEKERIDGGGGECRFVPNKNDKSRMITPAAYVLNTLRLHRTKQREAQLMAGGAWDNQLNLVFTDELGHHLYTQMVLKNFKKIVAGIDIPETRFHDLRHTYATLALQNGDDIKMVSEALGHATVAFTLDVYGHVT